MRRSQPMVAYAEPQTGMLRPRDTGVIFNGSVRVWLLTDDPLEAGQCGAKLHELGLPRQTQLIQMPTTRGMMAVNPLVAPHWDATLKMTVPEFLRWRGRILVLESEDRMDLMRFFKWLHGKNPTVPKQDRPKSLKQRADEGEIETLD
jgi:hypothetical protein